MRTDIERQKPARARAGQIRTGMRTYIETLGIIAMAYREGDHLTLGYESWDAYLEGEFNHQRVQLDPDMREKAITELRLGGLSQRAIATTLGVGRQTVADHHRDVALPRPQEPARRVDGKAIPSAKSPLVEAIRGEIEGAAERAEDHQAATADRVGPAVASPDTANRPGPAEAGATGAGSAPAPVADTQDPGLAGPAEEADARPASSRASSGGPGPTMPPAGPGSSRPAKWTDEERAAHEEEVQVRKDIESAHAFAKNFVTEVRNQCFTILVGYRLGESHLVTAEQIADCRRALDLLEQEVLADAQR